MTLIESKGKLLLPVVVFTIFALGLLTGDIVSLGYYGYQRWLSIVLYSILALFAVSNNEITLKLNSSLCWLMFVVYAGVNNLILFSLSPTIDFLYYTVITFAFYSAVNILNQNSAMLRLVVVLLSIVFFLHACLIIVQYFFAIFVPTKWDIMILAVGFDNVRFLNQIQTIMFPIFVGLSFIEIKYIKAISAFLAPFTIAFMLYSNGLGIFLALLIETFLLLVIHILYLKEHVIKLAKFLLFSWLFGVIGYWIFFNFIPMQVYEEIQGLVIKTSDNTRLTMWTELLEVWKQKPFLGYGGMTYADDIHGFTHSFGHPHNSILQILFEYGVVGLALLVVFFSLFMKDVFKCLSKDSEDTLPVFLIVSLLGGMALSLVSGVIVMPFSQLLIFVVIALLWSRTYPREQSGLVILKGVKLSSEFFNVLIFVVVIFIWFFSYISWSQIMGSDIVNLNVGPRFWLSGRNI